METIVCLHIRFYENERKKEAQVNQRIERMKQQLDGISEQQKSIALAQVNVIKGTCSLGSDWLVFENCFKSFV